MTAKQHRLNQHRLPARKTYLPLGLLCGLALLGPAANGQASNGQATGSGPPVAATVNGEPIYKAEIVRLLIAQNRMRSAGAPVPAGDFADVLNQLIMRRAVVQRMKREGGYFSDD
jgi:hypothetical protein